MASSINSSWKGHAAFGTWLVASKKPELVVDLGTYDGTSALSFASGCEKSNIVTIDKEENEIAKEVFNGTPNIEYRISSFADEVKNFEVGSIDILHIDGDHNFDSVFEDAMAWVPKLKIDGVLLIHDVYNPTFIGPIFVFTEMIETPKIMFLNNQGLGVTSQNMDILKKICNEFPGQIITGKLIIDIYRMARVNAEWMYEVSELSAQEQDRKGLREKIRSQLIINRSLLGQ